MEEKMEHEKLSLNIDIIRHRLTRARDCYDKHFLTKITNSQSALLTACPKIGSPALPGTQAQAYLAQLPRLP